MGRVNGGLIRDCERARKNGTPEERERMGLLVEKSQAECPHPEKALRSTAVQKSSRKYKRGGKMTWCTDCSGIRSYTPPTGEDFEEG